MEIWKPISSKLNLKYNVEVSENGNVRRVEEDGSYYQYSAGVNSRGYRHLAFVNNNGERKFITIHRLVALTFLEGEQNECINHIDGNRLNNHYTNLEWTTRKHNSRHATEIVGYVRGKHVSDEQVIEILFDYLENEMTFEQLSDKWEMTRETVRNIVNRRSKKLLNEHEYDILRNKHKKVREKNGRTSKKDRV